MCNVNLPEGDEDDLNNLLQIWDLDFNDIDLLDPAPILWTKSHTGSLLPKVAPIASSKTVFQSSDKLCTDCYASNVGDANWCIECGVALIGKSHVAEFGTTAESPKASSSAYHDSFCSNKAKLEQQKNVGKRHWKTSKSYLWRKPSSIAVSNTDNTSPVTSPILGQNCEVSW